MSRPASPSIIRHVTQALIRILQSPLSATQRPLVQALPLELAAASSSTLALHLYRVVESPDLRNGGLQYEAVRTTPAGSEPQEIVIRRDPLALNLHYLLIPFSNHDSYLETYELLGVGMKALHDNAIFTLGDWPDIEELPDDELDLQFRVTPEPLTITELAQIWEAVQQPYRLCISYVVRTVQIRSDDAETMRRVTVRRLDMREKRSA